MIITRTPYRVSFFGGGTDFPAWFGKHGGVVLSSTLDKYCYVSLREMPAYLGTKYRVVWSKFEKCDTIEEIQHNGVRGCLQALDIKQGVEVNHAGDLPARSGLGSSSAFTVGMLHALHVMEGNGGVDRRRLAREAVHVEQNILQETVGLQDQIACAIGGLNVITFKTDGTWTVAPLPLANTTRDTLKDRLLLFFTGIQRYSTEIQAKQVEARRENELAGIQELVPRAVDYLIKGRLDDFGALLDETWILKRALATEVSNPQIDLIYQRAMAAGALGGKVLGAGGGGFMLFYTRDPGKLRAELPELLECPFTFGTNGTELVIS